MQDVEYSFPAKKEDAIEYANRRLRQTGQHYIVSNEGHAMMDDSLNRRTMREIGLRIVYTTRDKR